MNHRKTIAFFKIGAFSHTNESVHKILKNKYPDYNIIVIDIYEEIANFNTFKNLYHSFLEYGLKMFLSKRRLKLALRFNSYLFNLVKSNINKKFGDKPFVFTFQTQSIFDTKIFGIPNFIYTDHTVLVNKKYPGFKEPLLYSKKYLKLEKTIYNNATIIFTMSNHVRNSIIQDYNCSEDKIKCVYAGPNIINKEVNIIDDRKYFSKNILFIGLAWERKGGPTLIKAFEKVLKTHPDTFLTIVGCSPKIDLPNCNIIGRVPLRKINSYYENASIFCLPTTLEPFGMVFIEAMSMKLPIISTNIGALPDFIDEGKNGFLIEPNDSDALSEYIKILLDSPEKCKEFGISGSKIAEERYTWEKVGKNIAQIIDESNMI